MRKFISNPKVRKSAKVVGKFVAGFAYGYAIGTFIVK